MGAYGSLLLETAVMRIKTHPVYINPTHKSPFTIHHSLNDIVKLVQEA